MITAFFLIAGLIALVLGGEGVVRGAVSLAARLGVPPMVIGLTLVGFGTSLPELVTSLQAAMDGLPGIAVGNVVGSNIANVLLIVGVSAAIMALPVDRGVFRRDGLVLALATGAGMAVIFMDALGRAAGTVFLVALAGYLLWTFLRPAADEVSETEQTSRPLGWGLAGLCLAGGLGLTVLGAKLFVTGASGLAAMLGVSEAVIGLSVVALGTSLPELVTSISAARQGQSDIAFGNVVGSNIFNILFILGVTTLVHPIAVPPEIVRVDMWVMGAATLALLVFGYTHRQISRGEGFVLLAAYAAYIGWLGVSSGMGG